MSLHREIALEESICAHLAAAGWLHEPNSATGYDRPRALFPDDLAAWVQQTQPTAWASLTAAHGPRATAALADRLRAALDKQGTLHLLRAGLDMVGVKQPIALCQFRPALAMNLDLQARHAANRLRVVRQLRYSPHTENSIDLALFLNGIPVATAELKSDYTQRMADAVDQYRYDRPPRTPGRNTPEPLLSFPGGALVHFSVSNSEVQMCTRLAGADSVFLPFNRGHDYGAGNPPNPDGAPTAYLWQQIWQPDSWLDILGRYIVPRRNDKKQLTGWIFPRFHQLDATRKLLAAVLADGPGGKYLIEHSAGSGKTNSIAWTAHFLADLHDATNAKLFDTVLVVSDRRVLDMQLSEALEQFERTRGVVAVITGEGASKSRELADALAAGKKIVVCTIQTFPFALATVRELAASRGKRFAVIADEAHSSQTGQAAAKLKSVLSAAEAAVLADVSDPNVVLDLRAKLEATGCFDRYEVARVAKVGLKPKATQGELDAALTPVSSRLLTRYKHAREAARNEPEGSAARQAGKDEMDGLLLFRSDLATYARVYDFLGQMFDYANTDVEKLYIFARLLVPLLKFERERDGVDLSALRLTHHRMRDLGQQKLNLDNDQPADPLTPVTETGSGKLQDKHKLRLAAIIASINDLFEGDLTEGDKVSFFTAVEAKLLESDTLRAQAVANTREQFMNSPNLSDELMNAIMDAMTAHQSMSRQALNSEALRARMLATILGPGELWDGLRQQTTHDIPELQQPGSGAG